METIARLNIGMNEKQEEKQSGRVPRNENVASWWMYWIQNEFIGWLCMPNVNKTKMQNTLGFSMSLSHGIQFFECEQFKIETSVCQSQFKWIYNLWNRRWIFIIFSLSDLSWPFFLLPFCLRLALGLPLQYFSQSNRKSIQPSNRILNRRVEYTF